MAELHYVRNNRQILARSGVTYFTPDQYDNPDEAQRMLAMRHRPEYRIGPVPADEMPDFDAVPLQSVGFVDPSRPGGGVEAATSGTVYLFGAYRFGTGGYVGV